MNSLRDIRKANKVFNHILFLSLLLFLLLLLLLMLLLAKGVAMLLFPIRSYIFIPYTHPLAIEFSFGWWGECDTRNHYILHSIITFIDWALQCNVGIKHLNAHSIFFVFACAFFARSISAPLSSRHALRVIDDFVSIVCVFIAWFTCKHGKFCFCILS